MVLVLVILVLIYLLKMRCMQIKQKQNKIFSLLIYYVGNTISDRIEMFHAVKFEKLSLDGDSTRCLSEKKRESNQNTTM